MNFFKKKKVDLRTWGQPGHLDASQEAALNEFKRQCASLFDEYDDDYHCCQFLRARKFDVNKSITLFREMKQWRAAYGTDRILNESFPHEDLISKYNPRVSHKFDKLGRPVYIELVGYQEIKMLIQGYGVPMDELVRYHVHRLESQRRVMREASARLGCRIGTIISILDLQGASMKKNMTKVGREFAKLIAHIGQMYYPESLGKMFVINAPSAFGTAWRFIKPFLDPRTVNKIEVIKGAPGPRLLEFIDADQLPSTLGGTCCCEGGCVKIDAAAIEAARAMVMDDEDVEGELGDLAAGGEDGPPPPSDDFEEMSDVGSPQRY